MNGAPEEQAVVSHETGRFTAFVIGIAGFLVVAVGLFVLLGIVAIAITSLPGGSQKAQNVVAISTSAFGVIGAIVGAYFGVRAAGSAVEQVVQQQSRPATPGTLGGESAPQSAPPPSSSS